MIMSVGNVCRNETAKNDSNAAASGGSVEEAVKQGVERATDIAEGKVKQGFFGKPIRK